MKKILIAACMLVAAVAAQADILFQEDFNTDGTLTDQGNWQAYSGADGSVSNAGGVAWAGAGAEDIGATNVFALQSGQVYAGLTLSVKENGSDGQYVFGMMNGNGVMAGRVYVNNINATTFRLGLSGDSTTPTYFTTDLTVGATYRIVLGYNNATDAHTLWVDPLASEEATPDLAITEAVASNINGFFIRQSTTWGADLASWTVDDLVVASDFANAVGVVPEPGTMAFVVLGALTLLARRKSLG